MRRWSLLTYALCLTPVIALFGQEADKPDYSGTWHLQSDPSIKWVLEQKPDAIHLKTWKGADLAADYSCNTMAKECKVKDEGREATVSFWFNGPKLVQIETRGNNIVKRLIQHADTDKGFKGGADSAGSRG